MRIRSESTKALGHPSEMKPTFALSGVWIAVSLIKLGVYGAGVAVGSDGQFFSQHRQ